MFINATGFYVPEERVDNQHLVYAQNDHSFKKGDLVAITVFGGGYSTGACLIKC